MANLSALAIMLARHHSAGGWESVATYVETLVFNGKADMLQAQLDTLSSVMKDHAAKPPVVVHSARYDWPGSGDDRS